jgi:Tfp pilus assembly protein PilF
LNFSDNNLIIDPMGHLTNLFQTGNMEQLRTDAKKIATDPTYRFFKFENEFNQTGYKLLNRGDHKTAIFVFTMITELFPDSANAWDSLAEGYLKSGDTVKATEYYNKAIKMDPHGPTGDNAREMLRSITEEHRE